MFGTKLAQPWITSALLLACGMGGCSTLRTTDPAQTATEQFLLSEATRRSIQQLTATPLRDRLVFVDPSYALRGEYAAPELLFMVAELRAMLLQAGARLTDQRAEADAVVEVRYGGIGIDRLETLFGIPSVGVPAGNSTAANVPILTPELAIVKRLRQKGFASVAYVAYWRTSGEIVTSSGPFVGRSEREDFWILGFGPRTVGDIPPAKKE